MRLIVRRPDTVLSGDLLIPASKYHAHRALILGALAPGTTRVGGLSDARHVQFTVDALRSLGAEISAEDGTYVVQGGHLRPQRERVALGSSGSTFYFLTGLTSLGDRPVTLYGQKYLQQRPVGPLLEALRALGVRLEASAGKRLPITVYPGQPAGGTVRIAGTLSQWISGLLMLAPFCRGSSVIEVDGQLNERPYVELTVRMLEQFGLHVSVAPGWRRFEVDGGQRIHPTELTLPADVGSAVFGIAAAALHPSNVRFLGTSSHPDHPEGAVYRVLEEMGVPLSFDDAGRVARVSQAAPDLRGTHVDCREMPDVLPILSVLGSMARGRTVLDNVDHVRLKESDRVAAMLQLRQMGARIRLDGHRLICEGGGELEGRALSSHNDHRVLMSLAVAGSRARGMTSITYPHAYRLSYPRFLDAMTSIGIPMEVRDGAPE